MNIERFVVAATSGRRDRADAMLAARPEIERDRWARLVLGRGWDGDPNEVGGPWAWPPLHYVAHSTYAPVSLARELLERGANPNAAFPNDYGPMSALYGAAGVVHDPELTRALLEGGADPNGEPTFGDALYHSCEAEDPACTRVLLEHGAEPNGTNALAHALDYDHLEQVRLLLDAGADPNEGALVAHAVRRERGPETLRLLAERGADLDRPGGETWRGDVPLRTPYQHAVIRDREDQARTLAELGASTEVSEEDRRLAALARGEQPDGPLPRPIRTRRRWSSSPRFAANSTPFSLRSGRATSASSGAARPGRSSTTRRGSATRSWCAGCSRPVPTRARRATLSSPRPRRGRRSARRRSAARTRLRRGGGGSRRRGRRAGAAVRRGR